MPIAKLMCLEERKGKLELVMEKTLIDLNSNAFRVFKALRKDWQATDSDQDRYRRPGQVNFAKITEHDKPITLTLNSI